MWDEFNYGTNRTRTELSALELENLPYVTLYALASANIDQSVPNLATIYIYTHKVLEEFKFESN